MIYCDNLIDLKNEMLLTKDVTCAVMGLDYKDKTKMFHEGHKLCIQTAKNTNANYTLTTRFSYAEVQDYLFNEGKYNEPVGDIEYMKTWLESAGVDYFYLSHKDDFINNWMAGYNKEDLIKWAKDVCIKEEYEQRPAYMTWFIMLKILKDKGGFIRKYWINSYKDGPIRFVMKDFVSKYHPETNLVLIDPVKDIYGNTLSSSYIKDKDTNTITKSIVEDGDAEIIMKKKEIKEVDGVTYVWVHYYTTDGKRLTECFVK